MDVALLHLSSAFQFSSGSAVSQSSLEPGEWGARWSGKNSYRSLWAPKHFTNRFYKMDSVHKTKRKLHSQATTYPPQTNNHHGGTFLVVKSLLCPLCNLLCPRIFSSEKRHRNRKVWPPYLSSIEYWTGSSPCGSPSLTAGTAAPAPAATQWFKFQLLRTGCYSDFGSFQQYALDSHVRITAWWYGRIPGLRISGKLWRCSGVWVASKYLFHFAGLLFLVFF